MENRSPLKTVPINSSSPAALPSPVIEVPKIEKELKREAQAKARLEKRKRERRAIISKELGHDIDTDEERAYEKERSDRRWAEFQAEWEAEEARRQALSPEERRREDIDNAARIFKDDIKPQVHTTYSGQAFLGFYQLFLLQTAPHSHNGSICRFELCEDRIMPGEYRIVVSPRNGEWGGERPFIRMYHVKCFEELLDLSSPHYVARFKSDRQKHTPDRGAQDILDEYISRWKIRINQAHKDNGDQQTDAGEGSSSKLYSTPSNETETVDASEHSKPGPAALTEPATPTQVPAASNESQNSVPCTSKTTAQPTSAPKKIVKLDVWTIADAIVEKSRELETEAIQAQNAVFDRFDNIGGDELDTWHITKYFPKNNSPDNDERYALSQALEAWTLDKKLAFPDLEGLSEAERVAKEALGERTIKRIQSKAAVQFLKPVGKY